MSSQLVEVDRLPSIVRYMLKELQNVNDVDFKKICSFSDCVDGCLILLS